MTEHYPPTMKILWTPLSRRRERVGVRVVIIKPSPLTAALRHPVFPDLCKVERDFILSPRGEESRF